MIGQTISHYKILEKLGAGGMGVVYRAEDTRLKRTVALKFLPPDLTRDPEAKQRFIHEAQAASALQHNNICAIHDIEETDEGRMFIVMDSYDGDTLRSRIAKGRLRIEEATEIAVQIAQGLAEAHQHGIVHRDVKPANIVVTKSGVVKILDFGLAKLSSSTKLTKTGSTLGTVAYMAPEQLQGSNVDARADIFSLGVMLFEMLTGHTPFRGDHEAALMYSIINEEPEPLQVHLADASSELIHVVSRALEKDPANRYKTVEDLLIDLRRVRKETSNVSMAAFTGRGRPFMSFRKLIVLGLCVVVATIVAIALLLTRPRRLPTVNPNSKTTILQLPINDPNYCSLSRDGKWIAVGGADQNGVSDIYYMNTVGKSSRRVTFDSTTFASANDCSPDGAWIVYTRTMKGRAEVAVVSSLGGPSRFVAAGMFGLFFRNGERILYLTGGFTRVPTVSGKFELASVKLDGSDKRVKFVDPGYSEKASAITLAWSFSPDGRAIAWVQTFLDFSQDVVIYELETMKARQVTFSRSPKGEVFWTRDNTILYSSFGNGNYDLWMCPAEGGEQVQLTRSRNDEMGAYLSDDCSKLLYYEQYITRNIHSMDIQTGKVTPITSDDRSRSGPVLSPDNRYAAYTVVPSYSNWLTWIGFEVYDTKGEHPVRNVCPEEVTVGHRAWSPDGKWIAYTRKPDTAGGKIKICIVSPFDGTSSKVVAEATGEPGAYVRFAWFGNDTLSWFSDMKTWMCVVDHPGSSQFYEDSTNARRFPGKDFVFYRDYRAGKQGWWIDRPSRSKEGRREVPRRVLDPAVVQLIAPNGEFCIGSLKPGEVHKVSLPDGTSTRLPFTWPLLSMYRSISQDGKSVVYAQGAINSKVVLWENPFLPN